MSKLQELIDRFCTDGVPFKPLEEVFEMRNGYTPSKNNPAFWENGTIPWFRMEDIRENGRILSDAMQHITPAAIKGKGLFEKNSFILATTATIGEHALLIADSLANQQFTNLKIRKSLVDKFLTKFIYYYMFIVDEFCKNNTNVSGFASVDMGKLKKMPIPVPPLEVQEEIVRILDTFSAHAAELQAELQARKEQYEYYRNLLLTFNPSACGCGTDDEQKINGVTSPPSNYKIIWKTMGEICKNICSGGTPPTSVKEYYQGNIPWLRTQEVDWKDVYDTEIKISEKAVSNSSAKLIPTNCVIIAMYGATAAKCCINKIPLATNQACCNLEINPQIANYRYVYQWICNNYNVLKAMGEGSQSNLNAAKIRNFNIPIPPMEVQEKIVGILDRFEALVNDLTQGLPAEIAAAKEQYEYYRNKLLTFKHIA